MSYNILTGSSYLSAMYPPGSIMAYVNPGSSADPSGWIICNGLQRTNNSDGRYNNLNTLGIGTGGAGTANYTPPNLTATFLRGSSANGSTYVGPSLLFFQEQQMINHGHSVANHSHTVVSNASNYFALQANGTNTVGSVDNTANELNLINSYVNLKTAVTTSTSITSNATVTGVVGGNETRPYNYGVYWILKL